MFIVYQTTNTVNGKIYIGVHDTSNEKHSNLYLGSGIHIKRAVKKYGRKNFIRETLFQFSEEMDAYNKEAEIVNEEFLKRVDVYNKCVGGYNSGNKFERGKIFCRDKDGKVHKVYLNDPRYVSGDLIAKNPRRRHVRMIHKQTGVSRLISKDSPPVDIDDYEVWSKDKCTYQDPLTGEQIRLNVGDPQIKEKGLTFHTKGKVVVRDKTTGEIKQVECKELKENTNLESIIRRTTTVLTPEGFKRVSVDHPRVLDGTFTGPNKGKTGLTAHMNIKDLVCPHCNKLLSKGNFKRWHGEKCKSKN